MPKRYSALQIHIRRRTMECDTRCEPRCQVEFWIWPPSSFRFRQAWRRHQRFFTCATVAHIGCQTDVKAGIVTSRDDLCKKQHVTRLPLPPQRETVN
jgi:hypothetical protein